MKKLKEILNRIDGKGYKAYKDLKGKYEFLDYTLAIDHVQGDPFATPSKIRLIIPRKSTNVNEDSFSNKRRKVAIEDHLTRLVAEAISKNEKKAHGTGKSGLVSIDTPGQEVLERTAVEVTFKSITVCLSVGLPARGRTVLGKQASKMLVDQLADVLNHSVFSINEQRAEEVLKLNDQQTYIRSFLKENGMVAFIANGAILPRESGISSKPLDANKAIPFNAPKELEISIRIPHQTDPIKGMAIRRGITLIVGGGYHGKSTLLKAIEHGVYDHIMGDGREYVITDSNAMKIRAEDGRQVTRVNISPFIQNLPYGKDTKAFSTENASGSTSQAANILESLEVGTSCLLIDEDTSATNFMIRDERMQTLVSKEKEPITPFVDKVRQLYDDLGVSTVLVMGGSGDYFETADCVIMMENYLPYNVTEKAKEISHQAKSHRKQEGGKHFGDLSERVPLTESLDSLKGRKSKVAAKGLDTILYGKAEISLQYVEQLVDSSQTRAIAEILHGMERDNLLNDGLSLKELMQKVEKILDDEGLASFTVYKNQHPGDLARPRFLEIMAALNRLRTLRIEK
ncbi:ABC-ATPase domain-containing protein [Pseudalkalibacillus caeni]|uniref:ATPase n=1 Tax=Exobacillus caeni TaxID=2574798 RepID=A0A5R9FBS2_9BACL|nr:ABC-ATPase domain-containing protein [Pseudalkalibacillus caeni]TLS37994.1 ATPase [Pseudalkalibacillus caeni]